MRELKWGQGELRAMKLMRVLPRLDTRCETDGLTRASRNRNCSALQTTLPAEIARLTNTFARASASQGTLVYAGETEHKSPMSCLV